MARNIKAFLRKRIIFFDLRHMRRPIVGIGSEPASVSMTHVTPGKDRSDFRYHLVERDWDVFVGRHPVLLLREAAEEPAVDAAGLDRPVIEKAVGAPVRHHPKAMPPAPTTVSVLTAVSAVW